MSLDAGNADMHNWHMKGEGKKIEQARKRKRENMQALVEMRLVPALPSPKRVRFDAEAMRVMQRGWTKRE